MALLQFMIEIVFWPSFSMGECIRSHIDTYVLEHCHFDRFDCLLGLGYICSFQAWATGCMLGRASGPGWVIGFGPAGCL